MKESKFILIDITFINIYIYIWVLTKTKEAGKPQIPCLQVIPIPMLKLQNFFILTGLFWIESDICLTDLLWKCFQNTLAGIFATDFFLQPLARILLRSLLSFWLVWSDTTWWALSFHPFPVNLEEQRNERKAYWWDLNIRTNPDYTCQLHSWLTS